MAHGKNQKFGWVDASRFTFDVQSMPSDLDLALSEVAGTDVLVTLVSEPDLHGRVTGSNTMEPGERTVRIEVEDGTSGQSDEWILKWTHESGVWTARNNTAMREVYEPRSVARRKQQRQRQR